MPCPYGVVRTYLLERSPFSLSNCSRILQIPFTNRKKTQLAMTEPETPRKSYLLIVGLLSVKYFLAPRGAPPLEAQQLPDLVSRKRPRRLARHYLVDICISIPTCRSTSEKGDTTPSISIEYCSSALQLVARRHGPGRVSVCFWPNRDVVGIP